MKAFTTFRSVSFATAVAVMFVAPAPAQAQQVPNPVTLQKLDAENLRLRVANPAQQASRVEVVALTTGQPLFSQRYTDAAYGHRFNFHDLPTGSYALKLKVGAARYRYTIEVATTPQGTTLHIVEPLPSPTAPAMALSQQ
ncbi:hypothetical protein GCM10023185_00400 [Hymenobacter saemangeumensis]|uniref:Carboxypeptidase regulatory-like domain-containing protein n=1 Tax=Hymenobacter saemangeumensis TaxID=1084522 RepID=A0ABP8HWM7_9BACT